MDMYGIFILYAPRCWYIDEIYLHDWPFSEVNAGKSTPYMEHMGIVKIIMEKK
jgi:hypothetical protein